jgi:hypothetical protein
MDYPFNEVDISVVVDASINGNTTAVDFTLGTTRHLSLLS